MFSDSVLTVPNGETLLEGIFLKIGNSRRNIKLPVTGYVINYLLPQIAICLTARKTNGRGILTPWANACCEFLNRPKPLILEKP